MAAGNEEGKLGMGKEGKRLMWRSMRGRELAGEENVKFVSALLCIVNVQDRINTNNKLF